MLCDRRCDLMLVHGCSINWDHSGRWTVCMHCSRHRLWRDVSVIIAVWCACLKCHSATANNGTRIRAIREGCWTARLRDNWNDGQLAKIGVGMLCYLFMSSRVVYRVIYDGWNLKSYMGSDFSIELAVHSSIECWIFLASKGRVEHFHRQSNNRCFNRLCSFIQFFAWSAERVNHHIMHIAIQVHLAQWHHRHGGWHNASLALLLLVWLW